LCIFVRMAQILTFGNQKGGTGKSTCAMLAATALSQEPFNYKTAIVDVDRQQSIAQRRAYDLQDFEGVLPFDVISYNFKTFTNKIEDLHGRYDLIILDVAGKLDTEQGTESESIEALLYADLLLIPFTPGNFSLDASLDYLKIALDVREKKAANGYSLEIYTFRNMHRERSRHVRALRNELEELQRIITIPTMQEPLKRYSLFEDADTLTSLYDPTSSDMAKRNFSRWTNELNTIIQNLSNGKG
jgi:cellulose biosynthesis protein BcsQ